MSSPPARSVSKNPGRTTSPRGKASCSSSKREPDKFLPNGTNPQVRKEKNIFKKKLLEDKVIRRKPVFKKGYFRSCQICQCTLIFSATEEENNTHSLFQVTIKSISIIEDKKNDIKLFIDKIPVISYKKVVSVKISHDQ